MGIEGWLAATALAVWLLGIVTATALGAGLYGLRCNSRSWK